MNVLFVTQSDTITLFNDLREGISSDIALENVGFFLADSWMYSKFIAQKPDFEKRGYTLLKEWEIQWKAQDMVIDMNKLKHYEQEIGDPYLLWSLVNDRRVFMGKYCKYKQSYTPRFSWKQMLQLLQTSLIEIDGLLTKIKPDYIISYIPAVWMSYLIFLFAKARKIPYLCYKFTKIGNHIHLSNTIYQESSRIMEKYYQVSIPEDKNKREIVFAKKYILDAQEKKALYEGILLHRKRKVSFHAIKSFINMFLEELQYRVSKSRYDNQFPGVLLPWLFQNMIQPIRAKYSDFRLKDNYFSFEKLPETDYIFFPLHTEPELSLTLYGKPYQNQIELIRTIALNLPIHMFLLVKDHPRSLGMRDLSYYKKILEIPNVCLIHPGIDSNDLVKHAVAVGIISGFIGFEAVLQKKPVFVFGDCLFSLLPDCMVKKINNVNNVARDIESLLNTYQYDEEALIRFIAAVVSESVSVNWYSVLMKRGGRFSKLSLQEEDISIQYEKELNRLVSYTIHKIKENTYAV
ncbi:hypothetical protein ACFL1T_00480 [Chlamydiota bacterium]